LEISFYARGAAEAGARGGFVVVVDVMDAGTSDAAALWAGADRVLGAGTSSVEVPVPIHPEGIGALAAGLARGMGTSVVVATEPRVGSDEERLAVAKPVVDALEAAGVEFEVVPNQGAELPGLAKLEDKVVVVVSATGGTAYDAAVAAGAPAVCFATTGRVQGKTGWEVAEAGARRAIALADEHAADITVVAASSNSADDCLAAFQIARIIIAEGFLKL
ncbi:MAG: hypothetical protein ACRDIX_04845, partial [Actinomycetota bacterium]